MEFIESGMVIGLGTGSTADYFLIALAAAIRSGRFRDLRGVPTSRQSERRAQHLGIPVATLIECPHPDLTVDGADEVSPTLDLIKGLGGALLREKIVAQASRKLIITADSSKAVERLGTRSALPVEVAPFAHPTHEAFFRGLGAQATLRTTTAGAPFATDNQNYIYDCRFPHGISDPRATEIALHAHAGIVETGLFLGIATVALIADDQRVKTLRGP